MITFQIHLSPSRRTPSQRRRLVVAGAAIVLALPVVATAASVDIPNAFSDGDPILASEFNENFDAIAAAINDNDQRLSDVEDAVGMDSGIPTGGVAFFELDACPEGWEPMLELRGRVPVGLPAGGELGATVGTDLADQETLEITEVPSHVHAINPPNTATTSSGSHSHSVDPPNTSTTTNGNHTHVVDNANGGLGSGYLQGANSIGDGDVADSSSPIFSAGNHTHTVNIGAFNSGSSGSHTHTVDIGQFNSSSAGVSSVDVTMPYVQLLACRKN